MNFKKLIEDLFLKLLKRIKKIYNEISLQLELGIFLRTRGVAVVKVCNVSKA